MYTGEESVVAGIFRVFYKGGPNHITPHSPRYGRAGRFIYELSEGPTSAPWGPLVGVTVLEQDRTKGLTRSQHSKCFDTLAEAEAHIKSLAEEKSCHLES